MSDYENFWLYCVKWVYLFLIVIILMILVMYVMYVFFNVNGFGVKVYVFILEWYGLIFLDEFLIGVLLWMMMLVVVVMVIIVLMVLLVVKYYKSG